MQTNKRSVMALVVAVILVLALCTACGDGSSSGQVLDESQPSSSATSVQETSSEEADDSDMPDEVPIEVDGSSDGVEVRVGALKGPTGMGMAFLMEEDDRGNTSQKYEFTLADAPDQVSPMIINGQLDIAALPVNMASILYAKTNKEIRVLAINALGVLHLLTNGEEITSLSDLKGKTIYATGQNASPEYVLDYVLRQNGLTPGEDVTIEFKSEHAELATLLAAGQVTIAMLPEPFVTAAVTQNSEITIALDLTKEWESASGGAALTTGCIIARKEFIESHPEAVAAFMEEYRASTEFANTNTPEAAALVEKYEIVAKAAIAEQAIPRSNITFVDGDEMKAAVAKYLDVLYAANPQSIGGNLPDEAFYYSK